MQTLCKRASKLASELACPEISSNSLGREKTPSPSNISKVIGTSVLNFVLRRCSMAIQCRGFKLGFLRVVITGSCNNNNKLKLDMYFNN